VSFLSPDRPALQARIRSLSCPRCGARFAGTRHEIDWRRTRVDVYHECGQMTSFTAPALRNDYKLPEAPGLTGSGASD